ncbi:hypothetical protein GTP46_11230 [Duganella sp. FT135W]|uniref:Uncharacterized protein n=1 Tax=Duganella flavida TaxID=2692175 RepID=A0A6L8KAD1_9BURK|nr:hypothetical protein [Duganella flavida]MYM23218.1 hypothetical protein [Duganella flavida]
MTEADSLNSTKLLSEVHDSAVLAGELLLNSCLLMKRVIEIGAAGRGVGLQIKEAVTSLKRYLELEASAQPVDRTVTDMLVSAVSVARRTARQAANSELEIRKLIGGERSPKSYYFGAAEASATTLTNIEESLSKMVVQLCVASAANMPNSNEMAQVLVDVRSMLELARGNTVTALEALSAVEQLHYQTIKFVRSVERANMPF